MSRDYKNYNSKKKPEPLINRFNNAFSFLTGLALGLFVAVVIYFQEHRQGVENKNVLLTENIELNTSTAEETVTEEKTELPEPQFDFYKILPNKEVNISEWESVEEDKPSEPVKKENTAAMYVLQVGSFKDFQAADEIKAKLALMGVTADIQRVVINGQDIRHRVRIGPYKDATRLQEAKNRLRENGLDFMLLELKVEDI